MESEIGLVSATVNVLEETRKENLKVSHGYLTEAVQLEPALAKFSPHGFADLDKASLSGEVDLIRDSTVLRLTSVPTAVRVQEDKNLFLYQTGLICISPYLGKRTYEA